MSLTWFISVDDHLIEPARLWQERVPERMRERGAAHRARRRLGVLGLRGPPDRHHRPQRGRGQEARGVLARADHLRGHAPRVLRAGRARRRHGPGQRVVVDDVPVVPALLRPGLPRGEGPGPRARVRAGVERLRPRGVRRRVPGPVHPDDAHPAVGPGGGGRRDRADHGAGRQVDRVLGEPDQARVAVDPLRLLGPRVRGGERDRHGAVDARRVVVEPDPHLRRHADARVHVVLRGGEPGGHAARLVVQRQVRAVPGRSRSRCRRDRSVGSRTSSSGPSRSSTSSASGRRASTST